MNAEKIESIMARGPIDFESASAPMALAWSRVASKLWSACKFNVTGAELRAMFGAALRKAWADVKAARRRITNQRHHADELAALTAERRNLEQSPHAANRNHRLDLVTDQISALTNQ